MDQTDWHKHNHALGYSLTQSDSRDTERMFSDTTKSHQCKFHSIFTKIQDKITEDICTVTHARHLTLVKALEPFPKELRTNVTKLGKHVSFWGSFIVWKPEVPC